MFDPEESIQLQGNTGPFIQYTHARIRALIRKAEEQGLSIEKNFTLSDLHESERILIRLISRYPSILKEAAELYAPSVVANYSFELSKQFNQFYQSVRIFGEPDTEKMLFRIALAEGVAKTLKRSMAVLGIGVPERM